MTSTLSARKSAFRHRVKQLAHAIITANLQSFLNDQAKAEDWNFLVTALIRRAKRDDELAVAMECEIGGTNLLESWYGIAGENDHLADTAIASAAAQAQMEAEWYFHNVTVRQMFVRERADHDRFIIVRTEGDWTHAEPYYAPFLRDAVKAVVSWEDRMIRGVPFLSFLATIQVQDGDGELHDVLPVARAAQPKPSGCKDHELVKFISVGDR